MSESILSVRVPSNPANSVDFAQQSGVRSFFGARFLENGKVKLKLANCRTRCSRKHLVEREPGEKLMSDSKNPL